MRTPLFLGVDGGASQTRARLEDAFGAVLSSTSSGPANIHTDPQGAYQQVMKAAKRCYEQAGLDSSRMQETNAVIGLAGADREADRARFLAFGLPFARYSLKTDAHIACLGAHGGDFGGVLISGTGSIAYALSKSGVKRAGGHGFCLGDFGSGAWIGLRAVQHTLRSLDLGRSDTLSKAVQQRFGARDTLLEWARQAGPKDYASLAPLVLRLSKSPEALRVLKDAGRELSFLVRTVDPEAQLTFAFMGGLSHALMDYLEPSLRSRLRPPLGDALSGALWLVRRLS